MKPYVYDHKDFTSFQDGITREWVMTNGIGGYAGAALNGAQNRTHQGYLIASLHPPVKRYVVLETVTEEIETALDIVSFKTMQYQDLEGHTFYCNGQNYLDSFQYDGTVQYFYRFNEITLKKSLTLADGKNLCAISYTVKNPTSQTIRLVLTPHFNFREHNTLTSKEDLDFQVNHTNTTIALVPKKSPSTKILLQTSEGNIIQREALYDSGIQLQTEVDLETEGLTCHFCPYQIQIELLPGSEREVSLFCTVAQAHTSDKDSFFPACSAQELLTERQHYYDTLSNADPYHDVTADRLITDCDHFLCKRASTDSETVLAGLPWFTDWGRDTMLSFTGLTLCTGRYQDAREILYTFSRYLKNGIVPNMFPDQDEAPLYNTVDASLWYFYAVYRFTQYCKTTKDHEFIRDKIYPSLVEIYQSYKNGTDFSIYMDTDGLIHAGSNLDQVTWMDVRVGSMVVTPRHGKPVEINALWYNALKIMEALTETLFDDKQTKYPCISEYRELAALTKASFITQFWNPEKNCLYDVIEETTKDDSIRPNQIYAVSLPFSLLLPEQERAVVATVYEKLYVGCGLRSLSRDHKDYHPFYRGALQKRDLAYHQGTAWAFLLGGFISAYTKVNSHSPASIKEAVSMLSPVFTHLTDSGCIGSISEVFDGDLPHLPHGCYAQAWSVAEILRSYMEDILPYKS